jgi:hypothetical protein
MDMWIAIGITSWVALSVVVMLLVGRAVALADDVDRRARRRAARRRTVPSAYSRPRIVALRQR